MGLSESVGPDAFYRVIGMLDKARGHGLQWSARCPAHEDTDPSLSVGVGAEDQVLLTCHGGCTFEAIVAALGMQASDLWPPKDRPGRPKRWQLIDRKGQIVATHVRQDLPDGKKRVWWERDGTNGLKGLDRDELPLYGLDRLTNLPPGSRVYITEGEKAADALARLGVVAVGTVTGAGGKPKPSVLQPLAPFEVVLWPDNDDDGRKHMAGIALTLSAPWSVTAKWVRWADAPDKGDAADYVAAGGTVDGLEALIVEAPAEMPTATAIQTPSTWRLISSVDLARLDLPEPKWAVPGIVPEGVLLVAGKPKFGKSWWVLDLCHAVATGGAAWGRINVEQGDVLYITFEDSLRRLQDRQQRVSGGPGGIPGLDFVTDCPRSDEGGVDHVMAWVRGHPRARLIVIDPLEIWRPAENEKKQLYRQDYDSLRPIVELARQLGISVIVVHHCNKMVNPDDPFDAISGTTGLQGVADAIGVFRREKGMADAVLFLKGKDVDYAELAFKSRVNDTYPAPAWELLGSGQEYRLSRERFETLEALWREPWQTPAQLAEVMDPPVTKGNMRKRLFDMAHDGLVRVNDGKYAAGVTVDGYLHKYGHLALSNADNGNASNAGNGRSTPPPPIPTPSNGNASNAGNPGGVTAVPGVTPVTGVTGVTPRTNLSICSRCKQYRDLPGEACSQCFNKEWPE